MTSWLSRGEPQFCSSCKAALISRNKHEGYDTESGNEIVTKQRVCPKKRWWKLVDHDLWEETADRSSLKWEKSIW